ncbi:MAG TPA: BadF/BadG/BcrA/BcrD ATPase family protein [Actinomycetota bacterium]|jgi:N-acetylglucosamine kinase-like BadF-type ATPase
MSRNGSSARLPAILAVDGGNSKTDAVIVDAAGRVLGLARTVAPSNVGRSNGSVDVVDATIAAAARRAGLDPVRRPVARTGVYCLAGADSRADERSIGRALERRGWTDGLEVRNDTVAVLRAGTERGWGVGLVCGAGINCIGIGPTGRTARFAALGELSGDLAAGGEWIGRAALGAAVRAQDGRGPRTVLERTVPRHFGLARPEAVSRAMYRDRIPSDRLVELSPAVFGAAAGGDEVARDILDRQADEVVVMVAAAISRLRLASTDVDVVLGGGVFRARDRAFLDRIRAGIAVVAPAANVSTLGVPPVLGAVLLGLDAVGASASAGARVRAAFARDGFPRRTSVGARSARRA